MVLRHHPLAKIAALAGDRHHRRRRRSRRRAGAGERAHPGDHLRPAARGRRGGEVEPPRALAVPAHALSATVTQPSLSQQRHRLELEPVVVERAARTRQVEAAPAARAGERAGREHGAVEAPAAARAGVAIGEQRALDVGHDERRAGHLGHHHLLRSELADAVQVEPGRRGRRHAIARQRERDAERLLRLNDALHIHPGQIGRRLLQRLPHRQLERGGGCRAGAAAALQAQAGDSVLHPEQLDVSAVRLHVRPHGVERRQHPLLERHRVEVVDQEQAGHRRVVGQRVPDPLPGDAGIGHRRDDPLEAGAVHLDHRGHQLLGHPARHGIGHGREPGVELLNPIDQLFVEAAGPAACRLHSAFPLRRKP